MTAKKSEKETSSSCISQENAESHQETPLVSTINGNGKHRINENNLKKLHSISAKYEEFFGDIPVIIDRVSEDILPLAAIAASFSQAFGSFLKSPQWHKFIECMAYFHRETNIMNAIESAGYFSHPTIPDEIILDALEREGAEAVSEVIEKYLQENWSTVSSKFMQRFESSGVDVETLAAMEEALQCRSNNLHRAVCRTVFPEIERATRLRFPPPDTASMASLKELRDAIDHLYPSSFNFPGLRWLLVYEHVCAEKQCYGSTRSNVSIVDFRFPNRHAIIHGLWPYSRPCDSMNSLIIADFMFTCINSIVLEKD